MGYFGGNQVNNNNYNVEWNFSKESILIKILKFPWLGNTSGAHSYTKHIEQGKKIEVKMLNSQPFTLEKLDVFASFLSIFCVTNGILLQKLFESSIIRDVAQLIEILATFPKLTMQLSHIHSFQAQINRY